MALIGLAFNNTFHGSILLFRNRSTASFRVNPSLEDSCRLPLHTAGGATGGPSGRNHLQEHMIWTYDC